ncbi:hypothetical protein M404DRAFT_20137 [Pisolithus tinctorius Marx 270]|uniref:Uncharacterized protein n=1 Tax=Pisolithus tinctorius Marx 270 TaxID=870435 RepID=A0A0C3KPE2_PISTI|nr:hypothetical protein M404DRAFT_20137 [Pisolithus tinctorius Marx 270]
MSGKAPPKGPRALLSSLPAASSSASTSTVASSTSPGTASSKIGAPPPTGPRSLLNGVPTQPRAYSPTKPLTNGVASSPTVGSSPNDPAAPGPSQKGKQVDLGWSSLGVSSAFLILEVTLTRVAVSAIVSLIAYCKQTTHHSGWRTTTSTC